MLPNKKYIYDLPYREREDLCRILDLNEKWKTLGGLMKYSTVDIQYIENLERRGKSPSDELLTQWSQLNHTVEELFVLLHDMKHYQAMSILKPFVDSKFHKLMFEGEENWTRLLMDYNNCSIGQVQPHIAGGPTTSAAVNDRTCGQNLNVMLPEMQKLNKPGFSDMDKIQNIGSPLSVEENNTPQIPQSSSSPRTPLSPPTLVPPSSQLPGQPQLSPTGIAVLSTGLPHATGFSNNHSPQLHFDLRANSVPQRKFSDGAMVTIPSDYQPVLPRLDYKELGAATNEWSPSNILGRGGFGTVFKGMWKNTDVAIKRIELPRGDSRESQEVPFQQSHRELQVLQRIHHENILQLYGFSFNGNQPCLVYQFMEKGSLEDRLQCRNRTMPLTWPQRYNIAKGAARGLQYLHTVQETPLIHGDIKSANILLDANFEPRIGDFGLTREGPQTHYTSMRVSRVHGTRPYLPDEFLRSKKLSTKVDTYSFGVVLFELATGLRAFDDKRANKYLKDEVVNHQDVLQLIDPRIVKAPVIFSHLIKLGKVCVSRLAKERPEMKVVCQALDQHTQSTAQVTPLELQKFYDNMHELHVQSPGNSTQPGSGPPVYSISRPPASLGSHPQNGLPLTGQASQGVSGNSPSVVGSQGVVAIDSNVIGQVGHPGQVSNITMNSRPSVSNYLANPQQLAVGDFTASSKTADSTPNPHPGTSSVEPLLPTVIPSGRNVPLLSPAISVMPPTGSDLSGVSSVSSLCESSDYTSHDSQPLSSLTPIETENPTEDQGPGNLPLLTVLGIRDDDTPISSELLVLDDASQLSHESEQSSNSSYPVLVSSVKSS